MSGEGEELIVQENNRAEIGTESVGARDPLVLLSKTFAKL